MALAAYRSSPALEFKGAHRDDPVTAADREIEAFLRTELRRAFPNHGLLGEEGEDDIQADAEYVWALDPLDGTANFASNLPLWAISMGLLRAGTPVLGCIWVPVGPSLSPGVYHARIGGGAWWEATRLQVLQGEDVRGRLVALPGAYWRRFGFRRRPPDSSRTRRSGVDPRSLGSIAVESALVAAGVLRLAIFVQPRIWDVVAGALLVQEAGGRALTWHDGGWRPLDHYPLTQPDKGRDPPALRHWSRPVLLGTPSSTQRVADSLIWRRRLPRRLLSLLGR